MIGDVEGNISMYFDHGVEISDWQSSLESAALHQRPKHELLARQGSYVLQEGVQLDDPAAQSFP